MAKKGRPKKHKTHRHHHHKKMGAIKQGKHQTLWLGLGAAAGLLGTILLDSKLLPKVGGAWKGGGEIVLGGAGLWKLTDPFLVGISAGMFGWGVTRAVTSFTGMTISGTGMNGFAQVPSIGGTPVKRFPQPSSIGSTRREQIAAIAAGGAM